LKIENSANHNQRRTTTHIIRQRIAIGHEGLRNQLQHSQVDGSDDGRQRRGAIEVIGCRYARRDAGNHAALLGQRIGGGVLGIGT
jgi:hypothetical protein